MAKRIKFEATVENVPHKKAIDVIYQFRLDKWLVCLPRHYGYTDGEKVEVTIKPVKQDKSDVAKTL